MCRHPERAWAKATAAAPTACALAARRRRRTRLGRQVSPAWAKSRKNFGGFPHDYAHFVGAWWKTCAQRTYGGGARPTGRVVLEGPEELDEEGIQAAGSGRGPDPGRGGRARHGDPDGGQGHTVSEPCVSGRTVRPLAAAGRKWGPRERCPCQRHRNGRRRQYLC